MTYAEAIQFLNSLRLFGATFGLGTTLKLAALAGNPQNKLRFIHVAGTNGKGSTCAMLESIYRAAGLRVGLFTSPHLVSFRERIQMNRELIKEADVVRLVEELRQHTGEGVSGLESRLQAVPELAKAGTPNNHVVPTFFEFVTVMALKYFAEQQCDPVIWETGLGGRLDATNIATPLASVITNIGFDHQQWLGDTLEKIATEKAGIIKPHIPVVTAVTQPEALAVIERVARDRSAPLTVVAADGNSPLVSSTGKFATLCRDAATLPLVGEHQRRNAALAVATVELLQKQIPVNEAAIRRGLETIHWPGRLQLITRSNGQRVLLDGAHNPDGAEALRRALATDFPGARPALVFGVFQDKDWRSMCRSLVPLASRVVLTPVHSDRTKAPAELVDFCREVNPSVTVAISSSLAEALQVIQRDPFVVITGSLYLVGEALELLHLATAPATDEKALNEWHAKR